jgi:hypothetical protein
MTQPSDKAMQVAMDIVTKTVKVHNETGALFIDNPAAAALIDTAIAEAVQGWVLMLEALVLSGEDAFKRGLHDINIIDGGYADFCRNLDDAQDMLEAYRAKREEK